MVLLLLAVSALHPTQTYGRQAYKRRETICPHCQHKGGYVRKVDYKARRCCTIAWAKSVVCEDDTVVCECESDKMVYER